LAVNESIPFGCFLLLLLGESSSAEGEV
jgi:hypothetical protein